MGIVAAVDWGGTVGLLVLLAVLVWLLLAGGTDSAPPEDASDPNAPDADGFTPADKYGYGYDYSWGDPFGDKDL